MIYKIAAIGPNAILVAAALMALLVIFAAFHKALLGAMGIHLHKRRRRPKRRHETTRLDIMSQSKDET